MDPTPHPDRGPTSVALIVALALAKLAIQFTAITRYGYFRDELYYLACAKHLAWGYVDQPPFSIVALAMVRACLGDSLIALRLLPLMIGAATVVVAMLIARDLGGGRFAQALTGVTVIASPIYLALNHYYSMNALDVFFWTLAIWLLIRALRGSGVGPWIALGAAIGLGLLNKISVLWLGLGMGAGLVLTSHRRSLATRGPWLAALVAASMFLPHVLWQVRHHWPTLEFMHNAMHVKMASLVIWAFLANQVLAMNPLSAPIWIAGLVVGLFAAWARPWRLLAWTYLVVLVVLIANGVARVEYLCPAYPMLLALGAIAIERMVAPRWAAIALRTASLALPALACAALLPLVLPLLPVETFIAYQKALGIGPHTEERHRMGRLPQHYADMFGWEEMAKGAAEAYAKLTPEERSHCIIFAQNYGEAGAVEFFGRRYGLPQVYSGHNSYWYWGPGDWDGSVMIILGGDPEDNRQFFESVEVVGRISNPYGMPYEQDLTVSIGRKLKMQWSEAWPRLRHLI